MHVETIVARSVFCNAELNSVTTPINLTKVIVVISHAVLIPWQLATISYYYTSTVLSQWSSPPPPPPPPEICVEEIAGQKESGLWEVPVQDHSHCGLLHSPWGAGPGIQHLL